MPRIRSTTVVASPATNAETAICTISGLTIPANDPVDLFGNVDITIGTSGVTITLKVERGLVAGGTLVATGGPYTVVAANRYNMDINCFDLQAVEIGNINYVLTATIGSGAATSTVNNVCFGAYW